MSWNVIRIILEYLPCLMIWVKGGMQSNANVCLFHSFRLSNDHKPVPELLYASWIQPLQAMQLRIGKHSE